MNRVFITLLTALFVAGFAGSALANHHKEDKKIDAHAECTHAAGEACSHATTTDQSDDAAQQCTKHAAGEECTCGAHGKSDASATQS